MGLCRERLGISIRATYGDGPSFPRERGPTDGSVQKRRSWGDRRTVCVDEPLCVCVCVCAFSWKGNPTRSLTLTLPLNCDPRTFRPPAYGSTLSRRWLGSIPQHALAPERSPILYRGTGSCLQFPSIARAAPSPLCPLGESTRVFAAVHPPDVAGSHGRSVFALDVPAVQGGCARRRSYQPPARRRRSPDAPAPPTAPTLPICRQDVDFPVGLPFQTAQDPLCRGSNILFMVFINICSFFLEP